MFKILLRRNETKKAVSQKRSEFKKLNLNKSSKGFLSNYSAILAYIISLLVAKYLGVQVDKTRDG